MQSQSIEFDTSEATLQHMVQRVLTSGRITNTERLWFHQAILSDLILDSEMMNQVRQVFDRLQMGLIKVVD
ncbi:MAG: hypothetical protein MUF72_09170 [Elainella sp. Prado103]|jgi:hypothetical protein|nr:hypothetical protein [Elainella sp. Prado103]